jgi:hypothetical protein
MMRSVVCSFEEPCYRSGASARPMKCRLNRVSKSCKGSASVMGGVAGANDSCVTVVAESWIVMYARVDSLVVRPA